MFSLLCSHALSEKWAVLFAGSNNYLNYRHQADICTMYKWLVERGFDKKHVIHFQFNDISMAHENPYAPFMFHSLKHQNVFPGSSKITFKGRKVTAQKFYETLKNLPSTSEDTVFVYYDNHGGPGVLGLPRGNGDYIYAKDLQDTFQYMYDNKKFKKLLFGIEACYSGSVGEQIHVPNMAIITAANNQESSFADVYDNEIRTYLTNEFTNIWLDYMNFYPEKKVDDMYQTLLVNTTGSHVMYYGDEEVKNMAISDFFGLPTKKALKSELPVRETVKVPAALASKSSLKALSESSDRTLAAKANIQLHDLNAAHEKAHMTLSAIAQLLEPTNSDPIDQPCGKINENYYEVLKYFTSKYGVLEGDDLPLLSVLVNLSNKYSVASIKEAIDAIC